MMGTETEYAVLEPHASQYNPVQWSFDVVAAAAQEATEHIRWDYRPEDPVNDMRGMRLERASVHSDILTDAPQLHITNVIAPNGGRIYVDHAHPEYASPETRDPFSATIYDHAGDMLMQQAAAKASARVLRNNVDGKGASWGTHENYMMDRAVPFAHVSQVMIAHFVTRSLWAGSGRVGIGEHSEIMGYQLSQRADYFHMKEGLQTTFERPIINTRDESHASHEYRRLHVIVGDANRMDVPQVLKLGTTSMLLWFIEHANEEELHTVLQQCSFADPVQAMHDVSHDLTLSTRLLMEDGSTTTAWNVQVLLQTSVYALGARIYGTDSRGEPIWPDKPTRSVMAMWKQALLDVAQIRHANDDERLAMQVQASRVEWLFKWQLMEQLRRRLHPQESLEQALADPKIASIDLRWAELDPKESLFARVENRTERIASKRDIEHAMNQASDDTRAWLRARLISLFPEQIIAVSWCQLTAEDAQGKQVTLDMRNVVENDSEYYESIIDNARDAAHAIASLNAVLGKTQDCV